MWNDSMLRAFLTLAETLNFTEAAKKLYVSQQAFSKQIARLEQELNTQLLTRERHESKLTQSGEIYLKAIRTAVESMDQAAQAVRQLEENTGYTLRIVLLEMSLIDEKVGKFLQLFSVRHPEINIVFGSADDPYMHQIFANEQADAAITILKNDNPLSVMPEMTHVPLFDTNVILCVHKDHPLAKTARHYMDFYDVPIFMHQDKPQEEIARVKAIGFNPDNIRWSGSIPNTLAAIDLLKGCTLVTDNMMIRSDPRYRFYEIPGLSCTIALMWPKANKKRGLCILANEMKDYFQEKQREEDL